MQDDIETTTSSNVGISAHKGFPNPALDGPSNQSRLALDLNQLLIKHPSSTYLFKISGHEWADQGIYDGDIALVDRARRPSSSDLVIVWRLADPVICRYHLAAAEDKIWGVIASIIHRFHE